MGSGKRLRYSLRKYGLENHKKEILEFFEDRKSLIEAEIKCITSDLIKDNMCMNLREGGSGGFSLEQQRLNAIKSNEKQKILREFDFNWVKAKSVKISQAVKIAYQEGRKEKKYFFDWNGRKHSEETKEILKEKKKGTGMKESNSQYGTCWITNGVENKKIKKEERIPEGWYKGRI